MPYASKKKLSNNAVVPIGSNLYGTCSTGSSEAIKVVNAPYFNVLVEGVTIHVNFTNNNTAPSPTLKVGSTEAKPIICNGQANGSWEAGSFISFTYYNGTWVQNDASDISFQICPFPVNGIYMSMDSANPSTIWSGTTWQRISKGKVLVGVDEDDTDFAANATGGEKTHKLTKAESGLPSHGHSDTFKLKMASPSNSGSLSTDQVNFGKPTGTTYTNANPISGGVSNNTGADASQAHNNLQPYMTCYIWQRTA